MCSPYICSFDKNPGTSSLYFHLSSSILNQKINLFGLFIFTTKRGVPKLSSDEGKCTWIIALKLCLEK